MPRRRRRRAGWGARRMRTCVGYAVRPSSVRRNGFETGVRGFTFTRDLGVYVMVYVATRAGVAILTGYLGFPPPSPYTPTRVPRPWVR